MAGHACACAGVGAANAWRNQASTAGWKGSWLFIQESLAYSSECGCRVASLCPFPWRNALRARPDAATGQRGTAGRTETPAWRSERCGRSRRGLAGGIASHPDGAPKAKKRGAHPGAPLRVRRTGCLQSEVQAAADHERGEVVAEL